ncbi:hypothetical protein JTE90_011428 [Oedothorax gibbosus]|uniref:Pre-C2HC domain-containing protein n=1 Tax=Oedothorax gibbosus TaxID=931172 RepID=A0AAV6VCX0_9ARAC|nr:hypothetical protein JTE90_011428 [Oedothorax gibbosus]
MPLENSWVKSQVKNTLKPPAISKSPVHILTTARQLERSSPAQSCHLVTASEPLSPAHPKTAATAKELLDNYLHPDSSAPSIGDFSNNTLPSTSSAMEINDDPDGNGCLITPSIKKTNKRKNSDTISPSIVHPNKFQHLNHETSLDDSNPSQEIKGNFTQINTRPTRIPPLIITNPQFKWTEIRKKLINSLGEERFSVKTSGEHFKLQMTTENGHRIASKLLENLNIDYSTYAFKGQNPLKVIIKNLLAYTDPVEILQALKDENLPIQNVHQLKKTLGKLPTIFNCPTTHTHLAYSRRTQTTYRHFPSSPTIRSSTYKCPVSIFKSRTKTRIYIR